MTKTQKHNFYYLKTTSVTEGGIPEVSMEMEVCKFDDIMNIIAAHVNDVYQYEDHAQPQLKWAPASLSSQLDAYLLKNPHHYSKVHILRQTLGLQ